TFEFNFGGKWMLINVALKEQNGRKTVVGFHVDREPSSLEARNHFTPYGKNPGQYAVLVAMAVVIVLIIWALVSCIRTPIPRRKWLWILFVLLGFCDLTVNWTTGQYTFQPLYVHLLGVGAMAAPFGPWMLSVSLPLGAVIFLLRRTS